MSRFRPPREPSSPYITPEGQLKLTRELQYLWKKKRPEVTQKVSEAAALGDRSENAEYIYGKKQLREIDGRIQFLSKRLDVLTVVDRLPSNRNKVFFGAWVTISETDDANTHTATYRLVGADEIGETAGCISIDSPMAKSLLGKTIGDTCKITIPEKSRRVTIIDISYVTPK